MRIDGTAVMMRIAAVQAAAKVAVAAVAAWT
jgi:hypothetical protein